MAKRYPKCVYCLKNTAITKDHVFPKSWFPEITPPEAQRWTVPCCFPCNQKFGKIEEELLLLFGMCVDPLDYPSLGIAEKALESINDKAEDIDGREKEIRKRKRQRLLKKILHGPQIPTQSVLPDFGPSLILPINQLHALPISSRKMSKFAEKLVRGFVYKNTKIYIDENHEIEVYFSNNRAISIIMDKIDRYGKREYCGPGIRIGAAYANDDPQSGLFDILVWQRLHMYASIVPIENRGK